MSDFRFLHGGADHLVHHRPGVSYEEVTCVSCLHNIIEQLIEASSPFVSWTPPTTQRPELSEESRAASRAAARPVSWETPR